MKPERLFTPEQFSKKIGISRSTIWRWLTNSELEKRLKMYDAKKTIVAGKTFIEIK